MEEKIIIQGTCNRIKGAFAENGHAMPVSYTHLDVYKRQGFSIVFSLSHIALCAWYAESFIGLKKSVTTFAFALIC